MENPVIVLAVIAVIFGVFNIVLWLFIIKGDKKDSSQDTNTGALQNIIFASEKRMLDTLTKMLASLRASQPAAGGGGGSVDVKKLSAQLAEALKGQNTAVNIPELKELKKAVDEVPGKILPISAALSEIAGELNKQRDFIEAIDGHLVRLEKNKT